MGMEGGTISDLFINEQIRDKEVRVIGENGEQLGVMPVREAMKLAEEAGVDLVKIAPRRKLRRNRRPLKSRRFGCLPILTPTI